MVRSLLSLVALSLQLGSALAAPAASAASAADASAAASVSLATAASAVSSVATASLATNASPAASAAPDASGSVSAAARGTPSGTQISPPDATVPPASDDPNNVIFQPNAPDVNPQPIRGQLGAPTITNENIPVDVQNPDLLAPPSTDHGEFQNAKWPFSLSHNRLQTGGWAREQNVGVMPISTSMAGVNMRLEAGAVRELHWHKTSEWAYILNGSVQVTAINADGQNFIGHVNPGDLWFFPAGMPHSLQATNENPDGAEFVLVFPDGSFSEDSTFLLTDWLSHIPKEVIAKNFQTSISAFNNLPSQELYIFPSTPPPVNQQPPSDPQGTIPQPWTFALSQVKATQVQGGTIKIVDQTTFPASTQISAIEVTVEPGAMREIHWHPTQDEWTFYISGQGRVTIFAGTSTSRTFDYQAGDVGFVPASMGHFVENTGNDTLHFLELFPSGIVQDVSLRQWLALTPPELVQVHLGIDQDTLNQLTSFKTKEFVVGPSQ
ncbi:oxalate decarboxylase [Dichomitus squalens LYAD-421 SS1]|uniref:oxalate decarboxylase n=1 Tax=Dichomitus squalens (strain LYAD-421) TaxID=732165 RepID=UPI0004410CA2|nr:oxalate decarboxylase [Dichomitus squalens LYAD-421 SS1]EJF64740.1 oxalate decarboxylase [Dichomitus squalens LYAD-421 SS1]